MANDIFMALVKRKQAIRKELEAIEAFENAMAANNSDSFADAAKQDRKPKRYVPQLRGKYQQIPLPVQTRNTEGAVRKMMAKVYESIGGYNALHKLDKVANGRKFITVCVRDKELRLCDYQHMDKSGRPRQTKLCLIPSQYDVYFARTIIMDIYNKEHNKSN